jgi:hypothetical protein
MAEINHNTNNVLTVLKLVYTRLPILVPGDVENEALISTLTLEAMYDLEPCFRIRFYEDDEGIGLEDWERVGIEDYYSIPQKRVIADLVSLNVLYRIIIQNSVKQGEENAANGEFLKKAKAGSAEVEFEQIKLKDSALFQLGAKDLLAKFRKDAINKAALLGCMIDVCDDCSIEFLTDTDTGLSFMVPDCGCGC